MFSLQDKVCVITGAGRGMGRAIAQAYASLGAKVVIAARSGVELDQLANDLRAAGADVLAVPTDVTQLKEMQTLADAAVNTYGALDVWVNNAGGFIDGAMCDWVDVREDALESMVRLNLLSYIYGCQVAVKAMRHIGRGGCILMMSSLDSVNASPGGEGCYGACKAALNHITETLAVEAGQYGIRVNAIAPGIVETPLTAPFLTTDAIRQDRASFYPLGRIGQPGDVASAAVYLASDEAAYVSGATLLVSGGAIFNSDPYRYMLNVAQQKRGS